MTPPTATKLSFSSFDALAAWFTTYVADGAISLEIGAPVRAGQELQLELRLADDTQYAAQASVLEGRADGVARCVVSPRSELLDALARHALARRAGRHSESGGRREFDRYDTFLRASFRNLQHVAAEYVTNVSRGGLFVRTAQPPPLGAKLTVHLSFPNGETFDVQGEVVRRVTTEESGARGLTAGVGLRVENEAEFGAIFESIVSAYLSRPRRVLVVDDDPFFLRVLADALMSSGIEVATALGGVEASHALVELLYDLDAVIVDLVMPGVNGRALIERLRRFGREMNLRLIVVSGVAPELMQMLVGPHGADLALSKATPMAELTARINALLR